MRSRATELLERRQVRPKETLQFVKTSSPSSLHPKKKACYNQRRMDGPRMTGANWKHSNSNVGGPWGRFGEPQLANNSSTAESLKQPRRKLSWDADESFETEPRIEPLKTTEPDEIPPAPLTVYSPTTRRGRKQRQQQQQQQQHIEDDYDFFYPPQSQPIKPQQDYLLVPPAFRSVQLERPIQPKQQDYGQVPPAVRTSQLERPMPFRKSQRRASTGEGAFPESPVRPTRSSITRFCDDEQPRTISLGGTRPCMETSATTTDDGPMLRRRTWLGDPFLFDRPIMRPFRQLSSEDLCIGEETDEDLSNRSMLRTADLSSRSNRSISHHSLFRTIDNADLNSGRSNRSIFSNRSNRSIVFGNSTHNKSSGFFRTPTEDELLNHSLIRSSDMMNASSRSIRSIYNNTGDDVSGRSLHRSGDTNNLTGHSNRSCFRSTAVSPLQEEHEHLTEDLEESIREISLHDSDHPSVTRTPTSPTTPLTAGSPGPWPAKTKSVGKGMIVTMKTRIGFPQM